MREHRAGRLERIRARLEAATPGPWRVDYSKEYRSVRRVGAKAGERWRIAGVGTGRRVDPQDDANAELIAHAPDDLRDLLAVAEAVEKLCADWEKAYPEDIFTPPPEYPQDGARLVWIDPESGEHLSGPFHLDQASAAMGRFMAGVLRRTITDALEDDDGE